MFGIEIKNTVKDRKWKMLSVRMKVPEPLIEDASEYMHSYANSRQMPTCQLAFRVINLDTNEVVFKREAENVKQA